jgi:hypothetical protein
LINSPRTILAFEISGIIPSELAPVDSATIVQKLQQQKREIPSELIKLRVEAENSQRMLKLNLVK